MSSFARKLIASSLFVVSLSAPGAAQTPGEVLWSQKISASHGNGPLGIKGFDQFGRGSAAIGDLDGDGVCDIAVGALGDDDITGGGPSSVDYGAIWILFMKTDGTVKHSAKISRTSSGLPLDAGDEFGRSVRELGDFDLDGIPDIMCGAAYDDDNGTDKGAFYLLFLRRDGSVREWKKISETSGGFHGDLDPDDQFGRGIRVLGDLDLDGVPDIGTGAIRDDDGGNNRGCYWILFMKRDGTVKSYSKLSETQGSFQSKLSDYGEFGFDCTVIGDRNGDGIQDIAISAPDQSTDGLQQGAVFIVYLKRDGTAKSDFRIAENYSGFVGNMLDYNDEFGCCIDSIGDVDNDGFTDIAVGAGKDDDGPAGSTDRGALYILRLNGDATVKAWLKVSALSGRFYGQLDNEDRFGTSLACPGDLNGDGIKDIFTGVRFDDDSGSGSGCMYFLALNDGRFTPPTAQFTYTPKLGKAPLAVQFSDQSTGNVNTWEWNFGDGSTSTERNPLHVYTTVGVRTVSLQVRGPAGSHKRTLDKIIKINPPVAPVAAYSGTPLFGMGPLDVQFTDASVGLVSSAAWSFGDGSTSTERSPHHVYAQAGSYAVALTVTNVTGVNTLTRSGYVRVTDEPGPTADFTLDAVAGMAPLDVQFRDACSGHVTAWSWNFGDGTTSDAREPLHTYVQPGAHTVVLTATGPGGIDLEQKNGAVTVEVPPAPVADFGVDTTQGIEPLTVVFTDHTIGVVTSWAWSFGDGASSNLPTPAHTYVAAGVYSVSLTVAGPGGNDGETKVDLITVSSVVRGMVDPSFETQTAGQAPGGAWTVRSGAGHLVEPSAAPLADGGFPSRGAKWLRISSAGTAQSLGPATPGGPTAPAQGGAGVEQRFYLDDPLSVLEFDASFVRGGTAASALDDDWMSVDVDDGTTTVNLFFADTFTATPEVSTVLGLPKTAKKHVAAALRTLFPASTRNTHFTLAVQVGNGAGDVTPSFGLVDDFRLEQAQGTALRYGSGVDPRGSLSVLGGAPRLGTSMTLGVDNPLGTQGPNSRAYVWLSLKPDVAYPAGSLTPNFGMAGAGAAGEVLVGKGSGVLLKTITGGLWSVPGTPASVVVAMPATASWIGSPLYVQGYLIDTRVTYGVRTGLTDALKLIIAP